MDCYLCDAYIATKNDDSALRQKLADQFQENFGDVIDPDKIRCVGCQNEGAHIGFCFECGIRKCSMSKGYQTCAECAEFPCPKGEFMWKENSQSLNNLNELRSAPG